MKSEPLGTEVSLQLESLLDIFDDHMQQFQGTKALQRGKIAHCQELLPEPGWNWDHPGQRFFLEGCMYSHQYRKWVYCFLLEDAFICACRPNGDYKNGNKISTTLVRLGSIYRIRSFRTIQHKAKDKG